MADNPLPLWSAWVVQPATEILEVLPGGKASPIGTIEIGREPLLSLQVYIRNNEVHLGAAVIPVGGRPDVILAFGGQVSIHAPRVGGDSTCHKQLHALQIACHKCDPGFICWHINTCFQEHLRVSPCYQGA